MWKAEEYYRKDSVSLALNGDGPNLVSEDYFEVQRHESGQPREFYAGSCYIKLGDYKNAIKQLKDYSYDDKPLQVRATGLLGDAYAEQGKKNEAVEQYKKAGTLFEDDNFNSPEYLFRAGFLYQDLGKNKEAIEMFKIIKEKYPAI